LEPIAKSILHYVINDVRRRVVDTTRLFDLGLFLDDCTMCRG